MKNYYSTIDGIVLTFSDIEEDSNGFDSITFRFERANDSGFDFADVLTELLLLAVGMNILGFKFIRRAKRA